MRRIGRVMAAAVLATAGGCAHVATQRGHLAAIDNQLYTHDVAGALAGIEAVKERAYKGKDRVLFHLDAGMLNHYNARWPESNELLTKAEHGIEEAYTRSISSAAASLMLNDNTLEYAGEDYEDVYLNVFKAINYLRLGLFDAAFVEVRRINLKLSLLEDKYARLAESLNKTGDKARTYRPGRVRFHNSALARYMSMLIYRAEGDRDAARIDMGKIREAWQEAPGVYDFTIPSFATALAPSPPSYTKLNVISFYGRSPDKLARTLYIHTRKDAVAILATRQKQSRKTEVNALEVIPWGLGGLLPVHSVIKFEVPYMQKRETRVKRVVLYLNGYPVQELTPIESIENVAFETFKIKEPMVFLKAITRTVLKNIAKAKAADELKKKTPVGTGMISGVLLDVAVALSENADLRIGQFFPAVAAISEVEVPVGSYRATVVYFDHAGTRLYQDERGTVEAKAGGLNLLHSSYLN